MLLSDIVALYVAARPNVVSESSWSEITRLLSLFLAEHPGIALDCAIPFTLAQWVQHHPEWESDWTRARVVRTIQRPFNWAHKLGAIPRNPFAGFAVSPGSRGRPMTDEEFHRAVRWARTPFRRLLTFLRLTGCRPCEARALEWEQIDTAAGVAVLRQHKTARSRRDRAPRVIVLTDAVYDLLIEVLEGGGAGTGPVFLNSRGLPWTKNAVAFQMQRLRTRAKLPKDCKLYGLRHRFGTRCAEAGVDLKAISELLGHTTTRMSEHYIHVAGKAEYLRKNIGKVAGL